MDFRKQVVWHWWIGASCSHNSLKICFLLLQFCSHWSSSHVSQMMWSHHTVLGLQDQKWQSTHGHAIAIPAFNTSTAGDSSEFSVPLWVSCLRCLKCLWTNSVQYLILDGSAHMNICPVSSSRSRTTSSWTCSMYPTQFGRRERWQGAAVIKCVKVT